MSNSWFLLLISSICLEGLGRKYVREIPGPVFYALKDVVLLYGLYAIRKDPLVLQLRTFLFGRFTPVLVCAVGWTAVQVFNPENPSKVLGLLGLKAYWLWWLAPVVIASSLRSERSRQRAMYALLIISIGVAVFAVVQFASPPDSAVNLYSVVDGEEVYATGTIVGSTGRARVASTFSFISGFTAFTILVPALLLSIGLEAPNPRLRRWALIATLVTASTLPMSGSRSSVVLGGAVLVITAWSSGLMFTRIGRRVMIGAVCAAIAAGVAVPEAFQGVQDRFTTNTEETNSRFLEAFSVLPPVALMAFEYPMAGLGTGMMQNARVSLNVTASIEAEAELARILVELGPLGFILVWTVRVGLMIALYKAHTILKRGGRRATAGAALSYAAVAFFGNATFDHIWASLYFVGVGFILAEVAMVLRARQAQMAAAQPVDVPYRPAPISSAG